MAIAIKSDSFVFVLPRKKLDLMKVSWATQGHWVSGPSLSPGAGRKLSPRYFIRAQLDSIKTTNLVSLAFNSFAV
jgi:hypothetical protein